MNPRLAVEVSFGAIPFGVGVVAGIMLTMLGMVLWWTVSQARALSRRVGLLEQHVRRLLDERDRTKGS